MLVFATQVGNRNSRSSATSPNCGSRPESRRRPVGCSPHRAEKFHPGRGRCVANGPGQFGDRFPGNRYDLDNIDPLPLGAVRPAIMICLASPPSLFAAALPFVDNHTFIVLCHCLPDNSVYALGQPENTPLFHPNRSERLVKRNRRSVPVQRHPLHPATLPPGGQSDQVQEQRFAVPLSPELPVYENILQVKSPLTAKRGKIVKKRANPTGRPATSPRITSACRSGTPNGATPLRTYRLRVRASRTPPSLRINR